MITCTTCDLMGTRAGQKIFKAKPPDKGSFPLDHDGECKAFMTEYMNCLKESNYDNYNCRKKAKEYLECRMERELMAKEDFKNLGFKDLDSAKSTDTTSS